VELWKLITQESKYWEVFKGPLSENEANCTSTVEEIREIDPQIKPTHSKSIEAG